MLIKNSRYKWISGCNCFEYKFERKLLDSRSLVTRTVLDTKISEVENKNPNHAKYITVQDVNKFIGETFAARLR